MHIYWYYNMLWLKNSIQKEIVASAPLTMHVCTFLSVCELFCVQHKKLCVRESLHDDEAMHGCFMHQLAITAIIRVSLAQMFLVIIQKNDTAITHTGV